MVSGHGFEPQLGFHLVCGMSSKWSQIIGLAFFFFIESVLLIESFRLTDPARLGVGLPSDEPDFRFRAAVAAWRSRRWPGKPVKSTDELRCPICSTAEIGTEDATIIFTFCSLRDSSTRQNTRCQSCQANLRQTFTLFQTLH